MCSDDYLVGLFDGEGCITATLHKNNKLCLRCSLEMTHEAAVTVGQLTTNTGYWGGV